MADAPSGNRTKRREIVHDIPDYWSRERKIEQLLTVAEMYRRTYWNIHLSVPLLDCDDVFNIIAQAMIKVVDEYDITKNTKLTSYALTMARFAFLEAVRNAKPGSRTMQESGERFSFLSFSTPMKHSAEDPLYADGMLVSDINESTVIDSIQHTFERDKLNECIQTLSARQRYVIQEHMSERTFKSIAQELGLSESRVYQIHSQGMAQIKKLYILFQS